MSPIQCNLEHVERRAVKSLRVAVDFGTSGAGPTLICTAGIHGNEPAGVRALEHLRGVLSSYESSFKGRLLGLRGNLGALERRVRYVARDLNRMWPNVPGDSALVPGAAFRSAEAQEMTELAECIECAMNEASGHGVYFLDLHTTSAVSIPFGVINDTISCRDFALHFPVPIILGLEEHVSSTIADWALSTGCVTMGFEAGQHDDPNAVQLHESAVLVALDAAAIAPASLKESVESAREKLHNAARGQPGFVEIIHRHVVTDASVFTMQPGFVNFDCVQRGQLLAHENGTALTAGVGARLFMPLYQQQGDDGYFLARPVGRFWLWLSRICRSAGLGAALPILPGVRRSPQSRHVLFVNPHIARFLRRQVFHLLGYRRICEHGDRVVFRRRD